MSDGKYSLPKMRQFGAEDASCKHAGFEFRVCGAPASRPLRFRLSRNSRCEWEEGGARGLNDGIQFWFGGRSNRCPHWHCVRLWMGTWGGVRGVAGACRCRCRGVELGVKLPLGVRARPPCNEAPPLKAAGAESVKYRIANTPPAARLFMFIGNVQSVENERKCQSTAH